MEVRGGSRKLENISRKALVLFSLLQALSSGPKLQAQGEVGAMIDKKTASNVDKITKNTNDMVYSIMHKDPEYYNELKQIYIDLDDPTIDLPLSMLLENNKKLIKTLINNTTSRNFLQALHDEDPKNQNLYLSQLHGLLPYEFSYIHEMAELYEQVQRLVHHDDDDTDFLLVSQSYDKEFVSNLIKKFDYFVLTHFLDLQFSTSKKLGKIIQKQVLTIGKNLENNTTNAEKIIHGDESTQIILGFGILDDQSTIKGKIYEKSVYPFSSTEESICYISSTPAGIGHYLCSVQDNYLNYSQKEHNFEGLEDYFFLHVHQDITDKDFAYHIAQLIDKTVTDTAGETTILLNGFSHFSEEERNCTSNLLFSVNEQSYNKEEDFGIVESNEQTITQIIKNSTLCNASTLQSKGLYRTVHTHNGGTIKIYTAKSPVDTDSRSYIKGPNNLAGIGSVETLKKAIESTKPTIVIATGQTENNFIKEIGNAHYKSEIRIEGMGEKKPSKYYHEGLKREGSMPKYFGNQGSNKSVLKLLQ